MTHVLQLNNGARSLAASLLSIPEQFKTPSDILRAGKLALVLEGENWKEPEDPKQFAEWSVFASPVEVTEEQRDMLKGAVKAGMGRIPPTKYAILLMEQLGFTE